MSDDSSESPPPSRRFYRRVAPMQWQDQPHGLPQGVLFHLRPQDRDGLSVYDAALLSPSQVIQLLIDGWRRDAASSDPKRRERGERFLARNGETVTELVANGWGAVEVAEDAFTRYGLIPGEPDATGHVSVAGQPDAFSAHSLDIVTECRTVQPSECTDV